MLVDDQGYYLVHPDLESVTALRFIASGVMAYLAAVAFRQVARDLDEEEVELGEFCERAYYAGTTLAILIPRSALNFIAFIDASRMSPILPDVSSVSRISSNRLWPG